MLIKNKGSPCVSVIVPTYNYAHFITDCLDSIFQQEMEDIEVIVIDDGSTDNTELLLKPYLKKIKYIYQDNQGLSAARNRGITEATGKYIQFLDSDDLLGRNALKSRISFLERYPKQGIAVCQNNLFSHTKTSGQPNRRGSWRLFQTNLPLHLCHFNIAPPHAFLLRKSVVKDIGFFDTNLKACEDYDYWIRAVIHGHLPQFVKDGRVHYRVHSTSMSANRPNQVQHDAILHKRLFTYIYEEKVFPVDNGPEHHLAFASGLALTITRLRQLNLAGEQIADAESNLKLTLEFLNGSLDTNSSDRNLASRLYSVNLAELMKGDIELSDVFSKYPNLYAYIEYVLSYPYTFSTLASICGKGLSHKTESIRLLKHLWHLRRG